MPTGPKRYPTLTTRICRQVSVSAKVARLERCQFKAGLERKMSRLTQ
jgi:hypothetical protein